MAATNIRIRGQYSIIRDGWTIMPTDTKKMAPNKSFKGLMVSSIRSASKVSAKMLPMIKAPMAAL